MNVGESRGWLPTLRAALGLPGLIIALLSLLMFVFGMVVVRRDFDRLERLRRELPRQILGRWVRTASADYLSVRNLVDEVDAWRRASPQNSAARAVVEQSLDRLGSWFESQNTRAPLLEVVEVRVRRADQEPPLIWRARATAETDSPQQTRIAMLEATPKWPAVWLDVSFRPDPDLASLGGDLALAYRRLLLAVVGLSGYSLLCLGFMAFHAHVTRRLSAREAAQKATIDLADRTCHELGNVAFVLTNEGRNLESHVELLDKLGHELPDALDTALSRAIADPNERAAASRALTRELSRRGIGLDDDLPASTALARDAWRQVDSCSHYISMTVRELDAFLKQSTLPVTLGPVPIGPCVDEALLLLRATQTAPEVRIERDGLIAELTARGDRRMLLHTLVNLLKNAIEATRSVADPVITIRGMRDGARLIVEIADNGPGIAPEIRHRLFERGASTKGPGHGRGLVVARESAITQGGTLELSLTPSTHPGACFRLSIPACNQADHPSQS